MENKDEESRLRFLVNEYTQSLVGQQVGEAYRKCCLNSVYQSTYFKVHRRIESPVFNTMFSSVCICTWLSVADWVSHKIVYDN